MLQKDYFGAASNYIRSLFIFKGRREEDEVVEKLHLFLDVLQSYKVSLDGESTSCPGHVQFSNDRPSSIKLGKPKLKYL